MPLRNRKFQRRFISIGNTGSRPDRGGRRRDEVDQELLDGLRESINELAEQAVAEGQELRLAIAAEVLRNGGADLAWTVPAS